MVVERFRNRDARPVYARAREQGRMECDDLSRLMAWIDQWRDLAEFEIVPVVTSAEAAAVIR